MPRGVVWLVVLIIAMLPARLLAGDVAAEILGDNLHNNVASTVLLGSQEMVVFGNHLQKTGEWSAYVSRQVPGKSNGETVELTLYGAGSITFKDAVRSSDGFLAIGQTSLTTGPIVRRKGLSDIFLLSLDKSFHIRWSRTIGTGGTAVPYQLRLDEHAGLLLVLGFSNHNATKLIQSSKGKWSTIIAAFREDGAPLWQRSLEGKSDVFPGAVTTTGSGIEVFLNSWNETTEFDTVEYTLGYDGTVRGTRRFPIPGIQLINAAAADKDGIVVAGATNYDATAKRTLGTNEAILVEKIRANRILWQRAYSVRGSAIALHVYVANDSIAVLGIIYAIGDPRFTTHIGGWDIFWLDLSPKGVFRRDIVVGTLDDDMPMGLLRTGSETKIVGAWKEGQYYNHIFEREFKLR